MHRVWTSVVRPLLDAVRPRLVIEIGVDRGATTLLLLPWAVEHGAAVHAIDPEPGLDGQALQAEFPCVLTLHRRPSLEALPEIAPADVVLLDGDHNWYTVINELRVLFERAYQDDTPPPVVVAHDLGWPYGRRDLYYEPDRIPEAHRHPFARRGMAPGTSRLVDAGFNDHLRNAAHEGGARNGVRTAFEDFLSGERCRFVDIPGFHGLGILIPEARIDQELVRWLDGLESPAFWRGHVAELERGRIEAEWRREQAATRLSGDRERWADERRDFDERAAAAELTAEQARRRADELERDARAAEERAARLDGELTQARARADALDGELGRLKAESSRERAESQRALVGLLEDRRQVFELTERLRASRSWRLGHGLFVALRRLTLRRPVGRSAVELILERTTPEPGRRPTGAVAAPARIEPHPLARAPSAQAMALCSEATLERLGAAGAPTIIVPVHDAADALRRCLYALVRHTTTDARLLLIDDASSDPEVAVLLERYASLPGIELLTNPENLGFTRSVNRGLEHADGDVVLLNSDAEVGPRWLELLRQATYSGDDVGSATAISNNAGAFSVPRAGEANPLPAGLTREQVSRLTTQASGRVLPVAPTGNGFCLYLRRAMLDDVGGLDAASFPHGYGEENDLCMRAAARGWRHVVDDRAFVYHVRSASFGDRKRRLMADGRRALDRLHPHYTAAARAFVDCEQMRAVRINAQWAWAQIGAQASVRPRVLFVVHEGGGGTPKTNLDLMRALEDRYEPFVLTCDGTRLRLSVLVDGAPQPLATERLETPWTARRVADDQYRGLVREWLTTHSIELVHVRHLVKHPLDVPATATALGIPLVLSVHDYYLTCPTVHLIDDAGRHCEGECTSGDGDCPVPDMMGELPPLKHRWVHNWRHAIAEHVIAHADAMVTTSPNARALHRRVFPRAPARFEVIEHGRDLHVSPRRPRAPRRDEPIRVLVPGNVGAHKGGELLVALHELDREAGRVELHFLGRVRARYEHLGAQHGPYERDQFADRVQQIAPHVVAILSTWPETYCHTLSEAWATGTPVVATDIGALRERVTAHGGGWLVPVDDPQAVYDLLLSFSDDPAAYTRVAESISAAAIRTPAAMAEDYDVLYREVIAGRRAFRAPAGHAAPRSLDDGVLRTAVYLPGGRSGAAASTQVRVLRRLTHPDVAWKLALTMPAANTAAALPESCDVVLVQRTALEPIETEPLLELVARREIALVVELDDDLLSFSPDDPEYGRFAEALRSMVGAAALVSVSTEALRERLAEHCDAVVVPNMLDERLWSTPVELDAPPPRNGLRVLYMGTTTHAGDLAMLREVLVTLRHEAGVDVELEVVGGERAGPGQGWYRRLDVPPGAKDYPRFVPWLRALAPRWDVAIAPLADTAVNRTKSDLKFLEYSALGLPGVYSASNPYRGCDEGGRALVVQSTVEAWASALLELCDADRRSAMAQAARDYVLAERTLARDAARYLDLLAATRKSCDASPV